MRVSYCDIWDVFNLQTYLSIGEYLFAFASFSPRITALPIAVTDRSSRRAKIGLSLLLTHQVLKELDWYENMTKKLRKLIETT